MNLDKLKQAEGRFLARYPEGFDDPGMVSIKKRHDVDKLVEFAQAHLTRSHFNQPGNLCETLVKIVSRSSMVSRFEKRLYGRSKRQGFEEILGMLSHHRLGKRSVISAVPFYFAAAGGHRLWHPIASVEFQGRRVLQRPICAPALVLMAA